MNLHRALVETLLILTSIIFPSVLANACRDNQDSNVDLLRRGRRWLFQACGLTTTGVATTPSEIALTDITVSGRDGGSSTEIDAAAAYGVVRTFGEWSAVVDQYPIQLLAVALANMAYSGLPKVACHFVGSVCWVCVPFDECPIPRQEKTEINEDSYARHRTDPQKTKPPGSESPLSC